MSGTAHPISTHQYHDALGRVTAAAALLDAAARDAATAEPHLWESQLVGLHHQVRVAAALLNRALGGMPAVRQEDRIA